MVAKREMIIVVRFKLMRDIEVDPSEEIVLKYKSHYWSNISQEEIKDPKTVSSLKNTEYISSINATKLYTNDMNIRFLTLFESKLTFSHTD